MSRRPLLAALVALALLIPSGAFGHAERQVASPPRDGPVPNQSRTPTGTRDVCKLAECTYHNIQDALDGVVRTVVGTTVVEDDIPAPPAPDGTLIRIWPGTYEEEPSRLAPSLLPDQGGVYSYQHHLDHPHSQNLIAIVGKHDITLRGMGDDPRDVVVDAGFKKHVTIRGDRADGLIIENLSVWHGFDHGVYVLDTDGFILDRVVSGYSRDYTFLTFANDHGLIKNCEAFGAGDGGLYPGSSADTPGRHSMEITNCKAYHNVLGYSGTQGDHVWAHDNDFFGNAVGFVTDSETDHPNYPQNNLVFERNRVYSNNFNPYEVTSDVKATVLAESILIPVGVGLWLASGNDNLIQNNQFWNNGRFGVWFLNGAGIVLGPTGDPPAAPFLSNGNRFIGNKMYGPEDDDQGNEIDFGWDGLGFNNCWQGNARKVAGELQEATSDAAFLPPCESPEILLGDLEIPDGPMPITAGVPNVPNLVAQAMLVFQEGPDGEKKPLCAHLGYEPCLWGPGPDPGNARNLPDPAGFTVDRSYLPAPASCGPSSAPSCWGA